jgi:hypothetical protein
MTLHSSDLFPIRREGQNYHEKSGNLDYGLNAIKAGELSKTTRQYLKVVNIGRKPWTQNTGPAVLGNGDLCWHNPYLDGGGGAAFNVIAQYNPLTAKLDLINIPAPPVAIPASTANGFRINGFTAASNGCVYASPFSGTFVLKYDPVAKAASWVGDFSAYGATVGKWGTFTAGHDGNLYAPPYTIVPRTVLKLDPITDTVTEVRVPNFDKITNISVTPEAMAVAPDGSMYMTPQFNDAGNRSFGYFNPRDGSHDRLFPAPIAQTEGMTAGLDGSLYAVPHQYDGVRRPCILRFSVRSNTQQLIEMPKLTAPVPFGFHPGKLLPNGQILFLEKPLSTAGVTADLCRFAVLFDPTTESFVELFGLGERCTVRSKPTLKPNGDVFWVVNNATAGELKVVTWTPSIPSAPSPILAVNSNPVLNVGTHHRTQLSLGARTMQGKVFLKKQEAPVLCSRAMDYTVNMPVSRYVSAALNEEGQAVFCPGNHSVPVTYDPLRQETIFYTIPPAAVQDANFGANIWGGGVLLPNGKFLFAPDSNNNFALLDFKSRSFKVIPAGFTMTGTNRGWCGLCLGHDGFVYGLPAMSMGDNASVLKFDYKSETFTTLTWPKTSNSNGLLTARSAVITEAGDLIGLPWGHNKVSKYNVNTATLTESIVASAPGTLGGMWWITAILIGNKVYGVPYNQPDILEYDIAANTTRKIPLGRYTAPEAKLYGSGMLAANELIYMFPATADAICEFNPATDALRFIETKTAYPGFSGLGPSVLLPTGDIAIAPLTGTDFYEWPVTAPDAPTPLQLSPYRNHS